MAIIGAGVAGCSLAASLCRGGWSPQAIRIWEAGRGPGGRTATRRSRRDPRLQVDHGASFFNIAAPPPPRMLATLLEQGWVEPWTGTISLIGDSGELVPAGGGDQGGGDVLLRGSLYRGREGMDQLCAGLLHLAEGMDAPAFDTLVRHVERDRDRWILIDPGGTVLGEAENLILTGTLLAHPRSRLTFGWPVPPLQVLAAQLQDPGLNHALAAISALRFEARSSLLMVLPPEEAGTWLELPFSLLCFPPSAQQRLGLWRISIQPLSAGACAVVAHSSATFAAEHIGVYGSRSAMARQLGLTPSPEQEQEVIQALGSALEEVVGRWLPSHPRERAERQLMRWGAAFPLPPGLPAELSWNPSLGLGFCGDFLAGPGFGRVEGAMASAELLAERLMEGCH